MSITLPAFSTTDRPLTPGRTLERIYALDELTTLDRHGDRQTPALSVAVSHDKDRRRYWFRVDRLLLTRYGYRTIIDYRTQMPSELKAAWHAEPAARYSAKQLAAYFTEYLLEIEEPELLAVALEYAAATPTDD